MFGIMQILDLMKKESCIFTIGFDQTIKGFGKNKDEFFCMQNPNKCLFTSIAWDEKHKLLYISDETGCVYIANVYMAEKFTIKKQLMNCRINKIMHASIVLKARTPKIMVINGDSEESKEGSPKKKKMKDDTDDNAKKEKKMQNPNDINILFVFTDRQMHAFKIKMGQKTHDIEGHTDSILKIIALEPQRLQQQIKEKVADDPKIITCSLDNTIRLWDSVKLDVLNVLESPEHSELSCMTFLVNSCLVATGHEDGALRLWNLDISSSVLLKSIKGGNHANSISCMIGETFKDQEFLIAGSYDGTISIWEISQKSQTTGTDGSQSTTIFPQFSHTIDNTKVQELELFEGQEVLCIHFY